ncbi:Short chain dehydrogenase [Sphaerulina musiva]
MAQHPPSYGTNFTPTIHRKPSGPTDPTNISLPAPFIVAIIGAGKGLGRQIALSYAKAGASGIVISSRTQADLDSLEGELKAVGRKKGGVEVWKKVCDVQNMKEVEEVARGTGEKFGRVDVVIANAGIISPYITTPSSPEQTSSPPTSRLPIGLIEDIEFERILNTNLLGSWRVAYTFLPLLLSSQDGMQACILITSIASHLSHSSLTPVSYNLSKMGMNRLVEHIHRDHGERDGVQAFAVHPGGVLTEGTKRHHETQNGDIWSSELTDDETLCGGFLTWLTSEKRPWLSGRYLSATWDVNELELKKDEIVNENKLVMRMVI